MSNAHDVVMHIGCSSAPVSQTPRRCAVRQKYRMAEQGSVAVMFVGLLFTMFGFIALALDLPQIYNRKVEMQIVADTIALAAAKKLDGTPAGIRNALDAAHSALGDLRYHYNGLPMTWSNQAIQFSDSPDRGGNWRDAGTATGAPNGLMYVKVDTAGLDSGYGQVHMLFIYNFPLDRVRRG